jgi:tetratricopeptide (TPR) repeat protein
MPDNDMFITVLRLFDEGKFDEAMRVLETALGHASAPEDEAVVRIGLATTLKYKSDYTGAFAQLERVFDLPSLPPDIEQRAVTALASLYLDVGQFDHVQDIASAQPNASTLALAALAHFVGGDARAGYTAVEREIDLATTSGSRVLAFKRRAQLEMWRALAFFRPGSSVAPADIIRRSLEVLDQCARNLASIGSSEAHAAEFEILEYRGIVLQAGGDLDGATAAMREAVRGADMTGTMDQRARLRQILLVNLLAHALQGNIPAVQECTDVVDALFAILINRDSPGGIAAAARLAALIDRQRGRLTNDSRCYRSAIAWLEHADRWLGTVRTRYWHPGAAATDAARREVRTLARACASLAIEILAKDLDAPTEVFEWVERTKATTLAELLIGTEIEPPAAAGPELTTSERDALSALTAATTFTQAWQAQRALDQVWNALERVPDGDEYVALRRGRTMRYAELRSLLESTAREASTASARDVLLVSYVAHGDQLLVFGARSDRPDGVLRLLSVGLSDVERDIKEGISDPNRLDSVLARSSIHECVLPILEWTNPGDLVCIVPTGPLFYVPLHAVCVGAEPLIARNSIFYTPSATILRSCIRGRTAARRRSGAAVFSNPTGDLRYAEAEADAVANFLGVTPTVRAAATRDRVLAAPVSASTVHFAGHAFFSSTDPLESGLVAAGNHVVTARDLFAAPRGAMQLVTLSACETGVNTVDPGDEIIGLTRAVLHVGAVSLIATLWKIDDAVSAELMRSFYDRWVIRGEPKVDALAGAQRDAIAAGHVHPYLWAAFTLMGDWY